MIDVQISFSVTGPGHAADVALLMDGLMASVAQHAAVVDAAIEVDHGNQEALLSLTLDGVNVEVAAQRAVELVQGLLDELGPIAPTTHLTRRSVAATHLSIAPGPLDSAL